MLVHYTRLGTGVFLHPTECAKVATFRTSSVVKTARGVPFLPGEEPIHRCWLCERGVDGSEDRLAPIGRTAADKVAVEKVAGHNLPRPPEYRALSALGTVAATRLRDAGHLEENVGVEIKSVSDWQQCRRETRGSRTDRFDRKVADAIELALLRYRLRAGFDHDQPYIEAIESGRFSAGCGSNVVETWKWLQDIGAPVEGESGPPPASPGLSSDNGGTTTTQRAKQATGATPDTGGSTGDASSDEGSGQATFSDF